MTKEKAAKKNLIMIIGLIAFAVLTAIDQWTKYLAFHRLNNAEPVPVIDGVFEFKYLENRGAAWGIFQNQTIVFVIISILAALVIIYLYIRLPNTKKAAPLRVLLIFLLSGAVGNLIDRVSRGYVIDFLYFKLIDFPIFNVADCYVTVSTFLMAFLLIFFYKEEDLDGVFGSRKKP